MRGVRTGEECDGAGADGGETEREREREVESESGSVSAGQVSSSSGDVRIEEMTVGGREGIEEAVSEVVSGVASEAVLEDDRDRVLASLFEDESIDFILEGHHTRALDTLFSGLKILEKENNLPWSVRYLSSAHLNIFIILKHLKESSEDSAGYGVKKNREKRSRRDMVKAEVNDTDIMTKIEKHLKSAHSYNHLLQGPLCPETVNTKNLLTQNGF